MNGKGDKRRPQKVDQAVFESNWDRIFKKKRSGPMTISEYTSEDGNRTAEVICEAEGFFAWFFQNDEHVRTVKKVTEQDAENAAEDWVLGLIE